MSSTTSTQIYSCITDRPLQSIDDDMLGAEKYAKAFFNFIVHAESPVSIGIQGNWGSGKTSLIYLLKEKLENDQDHNCLSVFVNAWEHSLFHPAEQKSEVALNLLSSLAEGIRNAALEKKDWLDPAILKEIDNKKSFI